MKEWFGGNQDGVDLFNMMATIAHFYDDLIDKDNSENISDKTIHDCFCILLIDLPKNKLYQKYINEILPLWEIVIASYKTANKFEQEGKNYGLEISHNLRYAAGHIVALIMVGEIGRDGAEGFLQQMWSMVVVEKYDDYKLEHLKE